MRGSLWILAGWLAAVMLSGCDGNSQTPGEGSDQKTGKGETFWFFTDLSEQELADSGGKAEHLDRLNIYHLRSDCAKLEEVLDEFGAAAQNHLGKGILEDGKVRDEKGNSWTRVKCEACAK